ncbi:bifunctional diguanylate cyclase/phosphodiesterase [Halomonas sp. DQ26W]|uniref:putative bifunctional diguanylate cyclase/phosphodiesterase n=1 Tax=Halomonas sp. DQ26W TaxID=2282311 RepID=UPI000DF835CC|nr:bifunctional diguanylate cyclase/phosphodiesterase [Halomonas sp. DQ26W]RDB42440.1 bifunctional diguanylate cyclase/phosphodiesterase [Halomonas sp. DQ26W]
MPTTAGNRAPDTTPAPGAFRSPGLNSYIISAVALIALTVFLVVFAAASTIYSRTLEERAAETAEVLSRQTFASMYQVMRLGWNRKQLVDFLDSLEQSFDNSNIRVELYRGERVNQRFGEAPSAVPDAAVRQVYRDGEKLTLSDGIDHRHIMPVLAQQECLGCHDNAQTGDVLGAVEVYQHVGTAMDRARGELLSLLLATGPLTLLLASAAGLLATRRINRSLRIFRGRVQKVQALSDMNQLETRNLPLGFKELDDIMRHVELLIERLRHVAVDRDVLTLERRLLEKFVINSNVIQHWSRYVQLLGREINEVIDAPLLITVLEDDAGTCQLDLFWRGQPSPRDRRLIERVARRLLSHPHARTVNEIHHHVSDVTRPQAALNAATLRDEFYVHRLDTPSIGNISALALQTNIANDAVGRTVLSGILPTLLNVIGSIRAIQQYTQQVETLATRDPLTTLHNQRMFWDLFTHEIDRAGPSGKPVALLVIDVDNFKQLNDRYGHGFGDRMLCEIADALKQHLPRGAVLARYGGDEFTLVLPGANATDSQKEGHRLIKQLDHLPLEAPDGTTIHLSASIGVAIYPQHAGSARDLFVIASNMVYSAKSLGKHRVALPGADELVDNFRSMGEQGLRVLRALRERSVVPYFQPIVATQSGGVACHEVLMRIESKGRLLPTSEFIPVAERMGVMPDLDLILMDKAFARFRADGYPGQLFVNLSPRAILSERFLATLGELRERHALPPGRVVLELTERDTVTNLDLLEELVGTLKTQGFAFAIDDFGSGYSSFHYLRRLPVDYLKIEGEFIRNLPKNHRDRAFVISIIALARELGVKTVAEFVENAEVLETIRTLGIDYAQGFHLGRPAVDPCRVTADPGQIGPWSDNKIP